MDDSSRQLHSKPSESRLHVLAIALPAQGHLNSMIRLCRLLASEHFTVTFVYATVLHERMKNDQAAQDAVEGHRPDLRMMSIPFPAIDLTNDFKVLLKDFTMATDNMGDALGQVVEDLCREGEVVDFLLCDVCMSACVQEVGDKYSLPMVCLIPFSLSFYLYFVAVCEGRVPRINDAINGTVGPNEYIVSGVPGVPSMRCGEIPKFKIVVEETEYMYEFFIRQVGIAKQKAKALLVNTFYEAERTAIDVASKEIPVYAVGPFLDRREERISTSLWPEQPQCIQWLDQQPPRSVVYISFGSVSLLSAFQFQELVLGLEASQQRFLWALRADAVEDCPHSSFVDDLLAKTKDRSCIVSWAPQLRVLSHASVGGFLTHCGWNSMMESVAMGVPVLCFPIWADQTVNCQLSVQEWGTGLKLESGGGGVVVVGREEVERAVRSVIEEEEGEVGKKVREMAAHLRVRSEETASTLPLTIELFKRNMESTQAQV